MTTIKESLEAINKAKYDLKLNASKETLKPEFKKLFADHPGLKGFAYLAWTPGFNDGDPCYRNENSFVGEGDGELLIPGVGVRVAVLAVLKIGQGDVHRPRVHLAFADQLARLPHSILTG